MKHHKTNVILAVIACSFLIYAYSDGITGLTKKNSGAGCTCHGSQSSDVTVTIEGPDTILVNEAALYIVTIKGGPLLAGGVNIAASGGILEPGDSLQIIGDELTHIDVKYPVDSIVTFEFLFHAPDTAGIQTLFANGNSVNRAQGPGGDAWNFADDKIITVISDPLDVNDENVVTDFRLEQNYPNPFNPATVINYSLPAGSHVSIKVYDILGREAAELVNEFKNAGNYSVKFDASELSSGVYFYSIKSGNFSDVKKMILAK